MTVKKRTPKASTGFTSDERAAMKARVQEMKAEARASKDRAAGEKAVLAAIAKMPEPDRALAKRVHAIITANERVPRDGGFVVAVALEMRVDQDQGEPLLERSYAAQIPTTDSSMTATVDAFGRAVDKNFAAFFADLAALGSGHAD